MKKRHLLLFPPLLLLLALMFGTAYAGDNVCGDNAVWTLENGTLTISGAGAIQYGDWGDTLDAVVIGEGITEIGEYTFAWNAMTDVSLPQSLRKIGPYAFLLCENLKGVRIPASVSEIGESAFRACNSLTAFEVDPANAYYTAENGVLFNKEKNYLICYPAGSSGKSYEIPASVSCIAGDAFNRCFNLESLTVGSGNDTYTAQDGVAFSADKTVLVRYPAGRPATQYAIPESVTSIEAFGFYDCAKLESLTIGVKLREVGEKAFYDCGSLSVDYAGTEAQWNAIAIGDGNDVLTGASVRYEAGPPTENDISSPNVSGKSVTATVSCVEPLCACFTAYGENGKFIAFDLRELEANTRQSLTFSTDDSGAKSYKIVLLKKDGFAPVFPMVEGEFTSGSSSGGGGSSSGGGTHVPQPVQQTCTACYGTGLKSLTLYRTDPLTGAMIPYQTWMACPTCGGRGTVTVYK